MKISNKKNNRNYFIMCILALLQGFVFYGPIATLYRQSRGITVQQIFITETILLITIILFEIPFGYFTDKYGYKVTLIISSFMLFISKVIFYQSYSFKIFLVQAIVSGIAFSGFSGCNEAFIYESIDKNKSEKAFGIYSAIGTVGFLLASVISSILSSFSLDIPVLATIFPFGIAFLLCFFVKDIKVSNSDEKLKLFVLIKDLSKIKMIFIFILMTTLITEVSHSIEAFLNQLQYIRSNIDLKYFGVINAACQLACLSSGIVYKFTKKFGQFKTLLVLIFIIFVNISILIFNKNWILSILCIMLIESSTAMIIPITIDIQNKSISNNRATMLSVYSMFSSIIASIINIFIGKYADISVSYSFIFCWSIILISFLTLILYNKLDNKLFKEKVII